MTEQVEEEADDVTTIVILIGHDDTLSISEVDGRPIYFKTKDLENILHLLVLHHLTQRSSFRIEKFASQ